MLLTGLLLKALCNSIITFKLQNHDLHPVPSRPNKFVLHHKYAINRLYQEFAMQGSFVGILLIIEIWGYLQG